MSDATSAAANEPPKTAGRFRIVGLASLCAVLMYLDRVCISILGAYIPEDLQLTPPQWARVLSVFFLAYALGQAPAGSLSDRFGARTMLAIYVLLWSACTLWTGLAGSFVALLLARLACGLSQAGAYPASGVLLKRWVPLVERGRASSAVALGGRIGGALAPALTAVCVVALTPADVATEVAPRDLLRPQQIARQLLAAEDQQTSELAEKIGRQLPDATRDAARRLAATEIPSPEDQDQLAAFLDSMLTAPWLSDQLSAATLGLPGEAVDILKIAGSERSARQIAKLHRLALEAAFPGSLRQIYTPAWRRVLWLYGGVGFFVAAAFWLLARDHPSSGVSGPATSVPDAKGSSAEPSAPDSMRRSPFALLKLLGGSVSLWLFGFTQFGVNVGWALLITLFPSYLVEIFQAPLEERGRMQAAPILVGCLGMIAGGLISDALAPRWGLRLARALPIGLTLFVCSGLMASCRWAPSAWAAVGLLSVVAVMTDIGVPSIWAFAQDVGGRHVGAVLGWGNMCGNLGAAASPLLLTAIKTEFGWNAVFATCAVSFLLAGISGLCLDASRPLEPTAQELQTVATPD